MNRVVHFEISASDPEQSADFYKKVFGWTFEKWDGPEEYWLVKTGENGTMGIDGGLMQRQDDQQPGTVNTIGVSSVDDFAEKVAAHGGEVVVPKMPIPGVGYSAYCKDPEGVLFGLFEEDASAEAAA